MTTHNTSHPMARQVAKVEIKTDNPWIPVGTHDATIEDWWDVMTGSSWMYAEGNPAAIIYAARSAFSGLPMDDEVLYVKIGALGHLIHQTELT